MQKLPFIVAFLLLIAGTGRLAGQRVEEDQTGAWYMYFFNAPFGDSGFGLQGDYQFRFWRVGNDLEQILLRTGLTYRPDDANVLFTLGYGYILSGTPGVEFEGTSSENRIYQEALLPHKVGERFLLTHRFRYEQRFVEGDDFRTRYRYNLFVNVLLRGEKLAKDAVYVALYNEIFINGQRQIGTDENGRVRSVEVFDRNRTYLGLGYGINDRLRTQLGWMLQTTNNWTKGQLQISLHQTW